MTKWEVIQDPVDPEMYAVMGDYLVARNLPIEDARLIAAAPELLETAKESISELAVLIALLQKAYGPTMTQPAEEKVTRIILGLAALERKHRAAITIATGQSA